MLTIAGGVVLGLVAWRALVALVSSQWFDDAVMASVDVVCGLLSVLVRFGALAFVLWAVVHWSGR